MKYLKTILAAGLLLTGCSSPSPQYIGLIPLRVEVSDMVFDIYSNGETAQAIRLNMGKPDFATFATDVIWAFENATGCKVVDGSLGGDFNVAYVEIDCWRP